MLKFILTLQICSMAMNTCNPPLEHKVVFDDWYSCAVMGSSATVKTFQNLGPDYVNKTGTFIKYWCVPKTIKPTVEKDT